MYLVTYHGVAALTPSLNAGTISAGWPIGNIGTFNPNKRMRGTGADMVWDRGSTSVPAVNGLMLVGHNTSGIAYTVYGDGSNPPTTSLATATPSNNYPFLATFTSSTARYLRLKFAAGTIQVGFASFVKYHDLGNPMLGLGRGGSSQFDASTYPGIREGGGTVSATFGKVAIATARTIAQEIGQTYTGLGINNYSGTVGHAGGAHPIALWDATNTRLWYGPGSISITEDRPGYTTINVSITEYPVGNTI